MKEFINDGENIFLDVPYAEMYIPEDYFGDPETEEQAKSAVASEFGKGIKVIGIFNIRFFKSEDEPRDSQEVRTFMYPTSIETYPTEYETATLTISGITDKYRILKYYQGDIIMSSYNKQDFDNCNKFITLITSGKIPKTVKYTDIFHMWLKNFRINGLNPAVPAVLMQVIVSEMCRDPKNPVNQFRKVAGKGKVDMLDYLGMNMNAVSAYSSVMAAMSFERLGDKIATSLTMTKDGVKQNKSPVEKVLSI